MFNRAVCLVLLVSAFVTASAAQTLPPADQVLVKLCVVNDQFLRAWPNPEADIVTDRARPSNIWTRATYFEGLMALHKIAPDPRYPAYAVRWAESHDWNLGQRTRNSVSNSFSPRSALWISSSPRCLSSGCNPACHDS